MKERPRTRDTKQRRVVYETIKDTHSHPTADWIFEKVRRQLPKVSLGTVYRNLGVLKEEGLVREIYGNDRRAHFDADGCEVEEQTVVFSGRCPGCRQDAKQA